MKEKPILFSGEMVRKIIAGNKIQTRRVMKPQPVHDVWREWTSARQDHWVRMNPYGQIGSKLWVKETFIPLNDDRKLAVIYRADCPNDRQKLYSWKPSIFMPRRHSRLTLEITGVKTQRLQSISASDCIEEGIPLKDHKCGCERCSQTSQLCPASQSSLIMAYAGLWDSINGKTCSWAQNPWVWVITFKRV